MARCLYRWASSCGTRCPFSITLSPAGCARNSVHRNERNLAGHFADERGAFLVGCSRPVSAAPGAEPFWFLDVLRHHLSEDIEHKADASVVVARREFCRRWCYPHTGKWADNACLLSY